MEKQRCEWSRGDKLMIEYHDREWGVPLRNDRKIFAKDLKKRGFKFLGPTIVYAHMQAVGMANDHITRCFRYKR